MAETVGDVLLEVCNLETVISTKAGAFRAVDSVSFTVRGGETLGIVGESGSGKSMTGLSLLRLVPKPAARIVGGSVRFAGEELLAMSEAEMRKVRGRDIAMILQDPQTSLNPVFTIGNQIMEALWLHAPGGRASLRERAIDALRKVRVAAPEHRVRSYPHEMSGGMRQRAVGAIAISCQPRLIIADEPTTSLDVTVQAQYLRLLQELQQETGMAIIFITHDFGIVSRLCHRLVVMYAGRIVESGPVRAIFDGPAHPYTEALIGSVPSLRGQVGRLPAIPGQPPAALDLPTGCPFAPRCDYVEERCRTEMPPTLSARSGEDHSAKCWRLSDD